MNPTRAIRRAAVRRSPRHLHRRRDQIIARQATVRRRRVELLQVSGFRIEDR